jgi:hypothetical protein
LKGSLREQEVAGEAALALFLRWIAECCEQPPPSDAVTVVALLIDLQKQLEQGLELQMT